MRKRGVGLLLVLTLIIAAGTIVQDFRFDNSIARERAAGQATDRAFGTALESLSAYRMAQAAYVAAGQTPTSWMTQASEMAAEHRNDDRQRPRHHGQPGGPQPLRGRGGRARRPQCHRQAGAKLDRTERSFLLVRPRVPRCQAGRRQAGRRAHGRPRVRGPGEQRPARPVEPAPARHERRRDGLRSRGRALPEPVQRARGEAGTDHAADAAGPAAAGQERRHPTGAAAAAAARATHGEPRRGGGSLCRSGARHRRPRRPEPGRTRLHGPRSERRRPLGGRWRWELAHALGRPTATRSGSSPSSVRSRSTRTT